MPMVVALFALVVAASAFNGEAGTDVASTKTSPPHIIFLFCDNVGWANVGFHRPPHLPARDISTPNIDKLARTGLILDRHYTYKFCSPSRSSVLTGRLPIHVNIYNDDPTKPGAGVPLGMTMISAKLEEAGYRSHMLGKWHVGMATEAHLPVSRGFVSSLHYFDSGNNYYNQTAQVTSCYYTYNYYWPEFVDLWDTDGPAYDLAGTDYEEVLFGQRALDIIESHPLTSPLFLYWALHTSCTGQDINHDDILQPLPRMYEQFSFIEDPDRRANTAMVALMDEGVGNVTRALQARGMWNNTLLLWSSDNGGAVHLGGGANNFPLRGGYLNNWEGGIRVAALLNGGFLPDHVRGATLQGFIHEADWYATFCHLAGIDPTDHAAAAASPPLPPIDSLNVWPLITGTNSTSPRFEWPLTPMGEDLVREDSGGDAGYMLGGFKLLVGFVLQSGWCGQHHPNATSPWDTFASIEYCTRPAQGKLGCLFDVINDPEERHDLALEMPDKAAEIYAKMKVAQKTWYNPDRGYPDLNACAVAGRKWRGWWGPFRSDEQTVVL